MPGLYNKIQGLQELSRFDVIEKIASGVIASRMTVYDIVSKEKRDQTFYETNQFDKMKKLGTHPHLRYVDSKESNEFFKKSNCAYFYLPFVPRIEEYFLQRKYMINSMMTQKIAIEIYGDSSKRVGQMIEIFIPKISSDGHLLDEPQDKSLSGDYLITSICHHFGKRYMCKMELSRNCMGV